MKEGEKEGKKKRCLNEGMTMMIMIMITYPLPKSAIQDDRNMWMPLCNFLSGL